VFGIVVGCTGRRTHEGGGVVMAATVLIGPVVLTLNGGLSGGIVVVRTWSSQTGPEHPVAPVTLKFRED